MNQHLFEKDIYNQSSHYENYRLQMEAIMCLHTFHRIGCKEGNKECIVCKTVCTSQAEVMSNNEKIKPIALAIVKLRLSEGII